jgi:dolichol kinase
MTIAIGGAGYLAWFTIVELASRAWKVSGEATRKLVHVSVGLSVALLPFVMTFRDIALLGVIFVAAMALSRKLRAFGSIHDVERRTWGEICFPLGVALVAALFPNHLVFALAVLTLAISDVIACLVGRRVGGPGYNIGGGRKTYAGSAAFFLSALLLAVIVLPGWSHLPVALVVAGLATVSEAALGRGFDNLAIPAVVAATVSIALAL